ncbi:hypothetical protein Scep_025916 [Stephania cephalantha]|uniref:Uncharacterized protein n=1 Tax=Stephania cephalantha TaxID=152367 RepID=A0AAP0EMD6_9MAGN
MLARVEDKDYNSKRAKLSGDEDHDVDGDQSRSSSSVSVGDNKEYEGGKDGDDDREEDGGDNGDEDGDDTIESNAGGLRANIALVDRSRGQRASIDLVQRLVWPLDVLDRYIVPTITLGPGCPASQGCRPLRVAYAGAVLGTSLLVVAMYGVALLATLPWWHPHSLGLAMIALPLPSLAGRPFTAFVGDIDWRRLLLGFSIKIS